MVDLEGPRGLSVADFHFLAVWSRTGPAPAPTGTAGQSRPPCVWLSCLEVAGVAEFVARAAVAPPWPCQLLRHMRRTWVSRALQVDVNYVAA